MNKIQKAGIAASAYLTSVMLTLPSFALKDDISVDDIISGVTLNVIKPIFQAIGALLLIYGVAQLVMAFRNEDAEGKSRSMMLIAASAALIGIGTFLEAIMELVLN